MNAIGGKLKEKRLFTRIKLNKPLRFQVRGTPEFNTAVGRNISNGGVSFINNSFIAPQTLLMLELNILSQILNPIGKVAWSSPLPHSNRYHLGIEFLEFNQEEKRYLGDYINLQTANNFNLLV